MNASLDQLLSIRSALADDIIAFCDAAFARLDTTGFSFKSPSGTSAPITISKTAIDARVFALKREPEARDDGPDGAPGARTEGSEPASPHEKALAELNENPWFGEQRKAKPWSRAFGEAKAGRPLVIRGAPGGGKTTLSRHSALQRLGGVREALQAHTALPGQTEPMLWTTCTALAECAEAEDVDDLVINAASEALRAPSESPARSERIRAWLRDRIRSGKCPVAVDSLDEVSEADRPAFQARAPRLLDLGSPVVLTCRVVEWEQRRGWTGWGGYEEGPFELAPLERREQCDYLRGFFHRGIGMPDKLDGMRRALEANLPLRRSCESPILLFFACLLHAENTLTGVTRRTALYQRIRRRLFLGEWKGRRRPPVWADGEAREARVTAWIAEIALALFHAAPEGKTFSLGEWDRAVASRKAKTAERQVLPRVKPLRLLADLKECGFLVYAGWGVGDVPHYSFPHRSFLVCMAGRALAARPREMWLAEALDHLWFQPAWEDVILFLAGHLNEADVNLLLEAIGQQSEDIFRQRLHWQWRIAGEADSLSGKWGTEWSLDVCQLVFRGENYCPSEDARRHLLSALGDAADAVPRLIGDFLDALDSEGEFDEAVRLDAAWALGEIGSERAVKVLLQRFDRAHESDPVVRGTAAQALGKIASERTVPP